MQTEEQKEHLAREQMKWAADVFGPSLCPTGKHWISWGRCAAFDPIPLEILCDLVGHPSPYPGDRGLRYEPALAEIADLRL